MSTGINLDFPASDYRNIPHCLLRCGEIFSNNSRLDIPQPFHLEAAVKPVYNVDMERMTLEESGMMFLEQNLRKNWRKLSMTGRLCYLFLCIETYLTTRYPQKDWTPVAKRCWQWTKSWWNDGWEIYSAVVPEFLFEFDSYEETNEKSFDGQLSQRDYIQLVNLFSGLTTGDKNDEINQLLMLPIHFGNGCEGVDFGYASNETMWILDEAEKILSSHHIPLPDMSRLEHLKISSKYGWNGWGDFIDSENLSLILNHHHHNTL